MSSTAKTKKKLLTLPKKDLIKKCKKLNLSSNGSKSDMIDRIINHKNKSNPDIDKRASLKPSKRKRKRSSSKVKKSKQKQDIVLSRNAFHIVLLGYIRSIEKILARNQIIPMDIYSLCFKYLLPNNIFITLQQHAKWDKYQMDIQMWQLHDIHNKEAVNSKERWQNKESKIMALDQVISSKNTFREDIAVCSGSNVPLPPKISSLLKSKHPDYDMLFRSGGGFYKGYAIHTVQSVSNECAAFIINDDHKDGSKIYNFPLPDLPFPVLEHNMSFDNKLGLFSIGGYRKKMGSDFIAISKAVYKLSFNSAIYKKQDFTSSYLRRQWKWEKVKSMSGPRAAANSVIVQNRLFVCGGVSSPMWTTRHRNKIATVELLDTEKNEWKKLGNMKNSRYNFGICYSNMKNRVLVGGGYGIHCGQTIEYYDFIKDKWSRIAICKYGYYKHPVLWIDEVDPNVVNISSAFLDERFERIDLRHRSKNVYKDLRNEYQQQVTGKISHGWWYEYKNQRCVRLY